MILKILTIGIYIQVEKYWMGVFLNSSNGIIDSLNISENNIKHIKLIGGKTGGSGWVYQTTQIR